MRSTISHHRPLTMILREGRWIVFLALSAVANVLIASAVTLTKQSPPRVPVLTVNLMARAAPAMVPQTVPKPKTELVREPTREPIVEPIAEPVPEPMPTAQPIPQPKQPPAVMPEKTLSPPVQKVITTPQAIQKVAQAHPQKTKKAPPQVVKPRKVAQTPPPPQEQATKEDHKRNPPKKEHIAPAPKKQIAAKMPPQKTPPQTVGASRDQGQEAATILHEARYRQQTPPLYPRRALDLGQQGTAILHVEVNHDGFTRTLKVAQSSGHRLLDRAALAAVRKWEFEPTQMNGERITSWVRVPVSFIIQSSQ